jgi:hypothetical protein
MRAQDIENKPEDDLSGLEVNYDFSGLDDDNDIEIVKGEDFTLTASKANAAGGLVYYLEMEDKKEIVGLLDEEELEELMEELNDLNASIRSGEQSARGVKPRVHIHKRPRCRDTGKPAYCGHRRCFNGVAMHIACVNWPFGSKKKLCTCLGVS